VTEKNLSDIIFVGLFTLFIIIHFLIIRLNKRLKFIGSVKKDLGEVIIAIIGFALVIKIIIFLLIIPEYYNIFHPIKPVKPLVPSIQDAFLFLVFFVYGIYWGISGIYEKNPKSYPPNPETGEECER
jgi:hypothetical protein